MKRALLVAAVLVAGASGEGPPPPPPPSTTAYQRFSKIFEGRVCKVDKDRRGQDSLATVQVQRSFKGNLWGMVSISGERRGTGPGRIFRPGQVLLFYLNDDLHVDDKANRVVEGEAIARDIQSWR